MAITAKESEGAYELPPAETYQAACALVCDIGTHLGNYQGRVTTNHQVVIVFELLENDSKGKPFQMSKFYTISLSEKANLRKDLQAWRGKPFTADELKGFDLEKLIGVNCLLSVIHEEKEGKTKAKISAIMKLPSTSTPFKPTIKEEPEWITKKRSESVEARGKNVTADHPPAPDADENDLPF